jgi:cytochrome b561
MCAATAGVPATGCAGAGAGRGGVGHPASQHAGNSAPNTRTLQRLVTPLSLSLMGIRNTTRRWGSATQTLHWLIVALIIVQATLALIAAELPLGERKLATLAYHKSVGLTILALATLRLLWRWLNPTPELPATLKPYERALARFTHAALYVLLFALPLSGWTMSSARGFPVSWFGFFQLPDLVPKSKPLFKALVDTHAALACTLAVVVALHIAGALKHHLVLKDDVLRRMLPFPD